MGLYLESAAQMIRKPVPLDPIEHLLYKAYQAQEMDQLYLIHRNKHREAAKMRRQRNMLQIKEQSKTPEKELNKLRQAIYKM